MHEAGGRNVRIALDLLHDGHGVGQLGPLVPGHTRPLPAHLLTHIEGYIRERERERVDSRTPINTFSKQKSKVWISRIYSGRLI